VTRDADVIARAARFRAEYGAHRAAEGRALNCQDALSLPYISSGPLARQWAVRARSFDALVRRVLMPATAERTRPLDLLDLGAGNGWLCYRAALAGHSAVAVDVRDDVIDGLGAGKYYQNRTRGQFHRVVASFDALPLPQAAFDVAVFNAALHYALDLPEVLREAIRAVRAGGRLVIIDSPFYDRDADGAEMVAEKQREAGNRFGERADALLALAFVEYLTRDRLEAASDGLGLAWHRHRVRYPLWYEARPLLAWLRGRRSPSRFDLWETTVT
jgi:SAM-dependent methyltransferase